MNHDELMNQAASSTTGQASSGPTSLASVLGDEYARDASDIHLAPGYPVTVRVHGKLFGINNKPLTEEATEQLITELVPPTLHDRLHSSKNVDCSLKFDVNGSLQRFRANVYVAQGTLCACLRRIPEDIPTFQWMGFPAPLADRLIGLKNGLVLVTGVTGSGKSTTLAALINRINEQGGRRIITVEEPIEYVHKPRLTGMITQREVGKDVDSFYDGLKYGLRQDPDVILVGEIRDRETARMTLSAAETGHLIFATMHTQDAKGAITRFVDLFPHDVHNDVRTQLALSLRSVVNQHLIPSIDPLGKRALAVEILHANQPVRTAIRAGKIDSLESAIQTGKRDGMVTLDEDLTRLCFEQKINMETARQFAKDPQQIGR
ncbi:MAG: type IV pilus twitching motility protein PilT [Phycisphaerae bacterium]